MTDIEKMQKSIRNFINQRDWGQFHTVKDLLISLNLEASEALEHAQWKNEEEMSTVVAGREFAEELADVLYWVLYIADRADIDIEKSFYAKLEKNKSKYPIDKSKGSHKKYTELK